MTQDMDRRVSTFVAQAYERSPGVRRWFDDAGITPADIQGVADLDKIPVLTKDKMVELQAADPPFGGFLTVPLTDLSHIFFSPGPLYEPAVDETSLLETAVPLFRAAGFNAESIVLNALSYHLVPAGLMVDRVLQHVGATVIPVGVGNADLQMKMLVDFGVTGYVGTPSWLATLLKKADEQGFPREAIRLRHALVTAEPLPPSLRAMLVDDYGIRVTNAYATAELGFLAYDQEGQMALRLLEGPIIQVVDRDSGRSVAPGGAGEVVVTVFNPEYPLIRFGTGDMAVNVDPAPGKSTQSQRAIILVGRVGDAVKIRGMFVHPNQLAFAMRRFPAVTAYQAVVRRPELRDEWVLRLVLGGDVEDRDRLAEAVKATVREVCRVRLDGIEFVDSLPEDTSPIVDERTWE